jgi:hypothetical protein
MVVSNEIILTTRNEFIVANEKQSVVPKALPIQIKNPTI